MATIGSLNTLVEAASLSFLFTFVIVCGLAFQQQAGLRFVTGLGVLTGAIALIALVIRLVQHNPFALAFLGLLVLLAFFGRPIILRWVKTKR